ncbi:hypothetical protein SAMN05446037_100290 [Anaerovirgula multivorans]|uniref:Uncharacterized protein n=1 Tax=Anaerovirgula multivorans TaxID=312168 RepID=A0A239ALM7_9FIRM|nr:hypothetical protein SAMN05446037_100290 [Anaerovirgula multivorans]
MKVITKLAKPITVIGLENTIKSHYNIKAKGESPCYQAKKNSNVKYLQGKQNERRKRKQNTVCICMSKSKGQNSVIGDLVRSIEGEIK